MRIITMAICCMMVCTICFAQNNERSSINSMKASFNSTTIDSSRVLLLRKMGSYYSWTNTDSALYYLEPALELARKIEFKRGEGEVLHSLMLCLTQSGDFTSALKFTLELLKLAESIQDSNLLYMANMDLMICYNQGQQDYAKALQYGHIAKAISEQLSVPPPSNHINLGIMSKVFLNLNQIDSALYYADLSLKTGKIWTIIYRNYGEIYFKSGKPQMALESYRKGIPLAKEGRTYVGVIDMLNNMSLVFESIGEIDSSFYYTRAALLQEGIDYYPAGKFKAATQLAKLYEQTENKDSLIKYQKLIIDLNELITERSKTREGQTLIFNEKFYKQELAARKTQEENKIRVLSLFGVLAILLLGAFLLWLSNRKKQKTNLLLLKQKEEIDKQRNKAEKALLDLQSTQAQLIQSEKMASLGELTAGIAHEIQNPLNFVNNFSEVSNELVDEIEEERAKNQESRDEKLVSQILSDIKQNLEKILHHGKRADAIVKGMLQHSRTSSGVKEPTDINALADEYLRLAYHGLRAKDKSFNADFKTEFDESLPKINVIPQDIGRVLLNLINNAFYAVDKQAKSSDPLSPSADGGTEETGKEYKPIVIISTTSYSPPSGGTRGVTITVKDNGPGIPQNIVDKIFQPFFTTKPTGQGTGLGLSLSYDIVKAHGGEIKAESKENEGSVFIIKLPIA